MGVESGEHEGAGEDSPFPFPDAGVCEPGKEDDAENAGGDGESQKEDEAGGETGVDGELTRGEAGTPYEAGDEEGEVGPEGAGGLGSGKPGGDGGVRRHGGHSFHESPAHWG